MVNWIGLARAMARLSSPAYVEFHQVTNDTFEPYMPVIVVGAALGGIVLAALPFRYTQWPNPSFPFARR